MHNACNFNFKWQFNPCKKFNNTSRNNWKSLFAVNFSKNSTKTIRLFGLNFYEMIHKVDSTLSLINYHLIEVSSY